MTFLEALILGLVQGAGEFLPVSSSGHLLLLEKLGVGEESLFFNICLHLGTLAAVLVAMRKRFLPSFPAKTAERSFTSSSPASRPRGSRSFSSTPCPTWWAAPICRSAS